MTKEELFLMDLYECLQAKLPAYQQESYDEFYGNEEGKKQALDFARQMINKGWIKNAVSEGK